MDDEKKIMPLPVTFISTISADVIRNITPYSCITLFQRSTGNAVVMTMKDKGFAVEKLEPSQSNISSKTFWNETDKLVCKPETLTIASIAGSSAAGPPYDYLKCAELHKGIGALLVASGDSTR